MIAGLLLIGQNSRTLDLFRNDDFILMGVDGLTSVSAEIASSTSPYMDGDTVNNVRAMPRGIVLTLKVQDGVNVEAAKRHALRIVKPKHDVTLRMTQTADGEERVLEISGIVESVAMPRFGKGVSLQISIRCAEPFWQDAGEIVAELSRVISMHMFPADSGGIAFPEEGIPFGVYDFTNTRTYTNEGDAECGVIITIYALAEVVNPAIYKADGSYIGILDTLKAGEEVVINTHRGQKSIVKNGVSVFNRIMPGSTFFQLDTGDNEFTIVSDGDDTIGNAYFSITFRRRFA